MNEPIYGVLFDKDGCLFDFEATWCAWAASMLVDLTGGDLVRAAELGALIGYSFDEQAFDRHSVVIAGTPEDIVEILHQGVPELTKPELTQRLNDAATTAPQIEAVPLGPLLAELRMMNLKLGVATNDAENTGARAFGRCRSRGTVLISLLARTAGLVASRNPGCVWGLPMTWG